MKKISLLAILAIVLIAGFSEVKAFAQSVEVENTVDLCIDGVDNDDDTLVDAADSDCNFNNESEGEPSSSDQGELSEDTAEFCSDSIDNDDDTLTDGADSDCLPFAVIEEPQNNGGSNNEGGNRSGSRSKTSRGSVLGASTDDLSCNAGLYLTDYMSIEKTNNPEQVKKLQAFLNKEVGATLTVNGIFGTDTDAAVKKFQLKYKNEVLAPWVKIGSLPSTDSATGYVYKTTLRMINMISCPGTTLPAPILP